MKNLYITALVLSFIPIVNFVAAIIIGIIQLSRKKEAKDPKLAKVAGILNVIPFIGVTAMFVTSIIGIIKEK